MPLPLKHFYMIRHGQTEANAAQVMAGSMDSPLTALGIEQAHRAKAVVEALQIKPQAIIHSQLSRARDTATIINESLNLPIYEDKDLAELHAGELEGAPYSKCEELFKSWPRILNGEEPERFFERVKQGKSRALEQFNAPVLIVCHGGVMRAFGALYDVHVPGRFENAHLYEFMPKQHQTPLPWEIFDYRLCEKDGNLIRSRSDIYDLPTDEEIAS